MGYSGFKSGTEILEISSYFLALIILGYWLTDFFTASWQQGIFKIWFPSLYGEISFIVAIIAGIYFGILCVTLKKDHLKRIQAGILLFFSIIVTLFHLNPIYNYPLFFLGSLSLGYYYANKQVIPGCRFDEKKRPKGKRPLFLVSIVASIYIYLSIINYLVGNYHTFKSFPDEALNYLLFAGGFMFIFYKFMNYETDQSTVHVLGPSQTGKTVFMAGLCDIAKGEPNAILRGVLSRMKGGEWPIRTTEVVKMDFTFLKGLLFTKCFKISTYDFPGGFTTEDINVAFQWLERRKDEIKSPDFDSLIQNIDLKNELPPEVGKRHDTIEIIKAIAESKQLIFIISAISINREDDAMVFIDPLGGIFNNYIRIYELIERVTDKPFMIVVNKIDKEYASRITPQASLSDVATWILHDITAEYLFSWDDIPENNSKSRGLIDSLRTIYDAGWLVPYNEDGLVAAKIEKIDAGRTIKVSTEKNSLLLRLNDEKTKVSLKFDDGTTDEFIARTENGKLNIYPADISDKKKKSKKKKSGTALLDDKRAIRRDWHIYNDESSLIFPCWIEEDCDRPLIVDLIL